MPMPITPLKMSLDLEFTLHRELAPEEQEALVTCIHEAIVGYLLSIGAPREMFSELELSSISPQPKEIN